MLPVHKYYLDYRNWLKDLLAEHFHEPEKAVNLLLPFIEGYPVVDQMISYNKAQTITLLEAVLAEFS